MKPMVIFWISVTVGLVANGLGASMIGTIMVTAATAAVIDEAFYLFRMK